MVTREKAEWSASFDNNPFGDVSAEPILQKYIILIRLKQTGPGVSLLSHQSRLSNLFSGVADGPSGPVEQARGRAIEPNEEDT